MDNYIKNQLWKLSQEDDLYILGDLLLGGPDSLIDGMAFLESIPAKLHLVRGNHDTDKRWEAYKQLPNVVEMDNAIYLKWNGYHFYLSHYPTFTANLEKESLKQCLINLYGHTHQKESFYQDIPWMYHVGLDSHKNKPMPIEDILIEVYAKIKECKEFLDI